MLLGIAIMLVSIYIPHEVALAKGGYEIFIMIFGMILTLIGFFKKDH